MTAVVSVLATLVIVLLLGSVAASGAFRRRELERKADSQLDYAVADRLLDSLYVERVVVTLRSGESFSGLLADTDPKSLLLRSAQALTSDGQSLAVDGELLIPRVDVQYIQKP